MRGPDSIRGKRSVAGIDSAPEVAPSGCRSDSLPMRGSSNPVGLPNSERSSSAMSSPVPDEPLFQFITISPQTKTTLTTVATIRRGRDRNAATSLIVMVECGDCFVRGVLASDRDLTADRAGFSGAGTLFGAVSNSVKFAGTASVAGSVTGELIGTGMAEIEDNTATEHHSGSNSKFDSDSDTASSRKTRMSPRMIGLEPGKL